MRKWVRPREAVVARKVGANRHRSAKGRYPGEPPQTPFYPVDFSVHGMVTELREMDLDVNAGDLSDIKIVPISTLVTTEELHSPINAESMARQMLLGVRSFPIVVRGNQIIDGHHRFAASVIAGYTHVPVRELKVSIESLRDRL